MLSISHIILCNIIYFILFYLSDWDGCRDRTDGNLNLTSRLQYLKPTPRYGTCCTVLTTRLFSSSFFLLFYENEINQDELSYMTISVSLHSIRYFNKIYPQHFLLSIKFIIISLLHYNIYFYHYLGHRATFLDDTNELLMYGGMAYYQKQVPSTMQTYPTVVKGEGEREREGGRESMCVYG